jgi:5-(carboxyamino)imidazole ribonucleotide synthase
MLNIIGHIPVLRDVLAVEGAHLHLYGKSPTEKRKVGHVTLVARSEAELGPRLAQVERVLVGAERSI